MRNVPSRQASARLDQEYEPMEEVDDLPHSPAVAPRSTAVAVRSLSKTFQRAGGDLVAAVDDVDVDVYGNELVVLLGPSGCGKTTLLRCLAGLEEPDGGAIDIDDTTVYSSTTGVHTPPNERDVNMMFQSYALWPHMTIEDNVSYPLRISGTNKSKARSRANEFLALVGLEGLGKQYAGNVSGGQQQRAALARTLISEPAVVLFDEPLSNVDAKVRAQLRLELLRLHDELGFAAVYVTHDQIEAMGLGTRIAVMRSGRIEQLAPPVDVYERPTSEYVAEFIGAVNLLEGEVIGESPGGEVVLDTAHGRLTASTNFTTRGSRLSRGDRCGVMFRPEYCELLLNSRPDDDHNLFGARVQTALYSGAHTEYTCVTDSALELTIWRMEEVPVATDSQVSVRIPTGAIRLLELA